MLEKSIRLLKDLTEANKKKLKDELGKKLGTRSHAKVYEELIKDATKDTYREKIQNFLTNKIETDNAKRIELFKEIKTKLDEAASELSNGEPNLSDVRDSLGEAIEKIVEVIRLDEGILEREKEMYRENRFLEHISSEEIPDTGGTGPRR